MEPLSLGGVGAGEGFSLENSLAGLTLHTQSEVVIRFLTVSVCFLFLSNDIGVSTTDQTGPKALVQTQSIWFGIKFRQPTSKT